MSGMTTPLPPPPPGAKAPGRLRRSWDNQQERHQRAVASRVYDVVVNKNSVNTTWLTITLNQRYDDGWEVDQMFEQARNTVIVFRRRS